MSDAPVDIPFSSKWNNFYTLYFTVCIDRISLCSFSTRQNLSKSSWSGDLQFRAENKSGSTYAHVTPKDKNRDALDCTPRSSPSRFRWLSFSLYFGSSCRPRRSYQTRRRHDLLLRFESFSADIGEDREGVRRKMARKGCNMDIFFGCTYLCIRICTLARHGAVEL